MKITASITSLTHHTTVHKATLEMYRCLCVHFAVVPCRDFGPEIHQISLSRNILVSLTANHKSMRKNTSMHYAKCSQDVMIPLLAHEKMSWKNKIRPLKKAVQFKRD